MNKIRKEIYKLIIIATIAISLVYIFLNRNFNYISIGITTVYVAIVLVLMITLVYSVRKEVIEFVESVGYTLDKIIENGDIRGIEDNRDGLISRLNHKLKKFFLVAKNDRDKAREEKQRVQSLISDISHQMKTPLANLGMYIDLITDNNTRDDEKDELLKRMYIQSTKLEWLVQSLIKLSRLESDMILLHKEDTNINKTIAQALSGVLIKAENKKINIKVSCNNEIKVSHDTKWISEAIFNIIENAIKYSEYNGDIQINVSELEFFIRIDIIDSGIGINEEEVNNIFKRFYRSRDVRAVEGIGIGLFLSKEIISKHGGYIKVKSVKGKGSNFSIFLKI